MFRITKNNLWYLETDWYWFQRLAGFPPVFIKRKFPPVKAPVYTWINWIRKKA